MLEKRRTWIPPLLRGLKKSAMEARPCTCLHGEKPIASNTLAPRVAPLSQFLPLLSCWQRGYHPVLHVVAHHGVDISSVDFLDTETVREALSGL
jgi:hypothetical protein